MINGNVKNFLLVFEMCVVKMLVVVMGVFVISWGLFFIINIVYGFCIWCVMFDFVVVVKWMYYFNLVFNFIVYVCMNKEFRKVFCIILFGCKCCCCLWGRVEIIMDYIEFSLGNYF